MKKKYFVIGGTTTIRVPAREKDCIRGLVDLLVEMESNDIVVARALSRVISDAEGWIGYCEEQGMDMTDSHRNIEVVKKLKEHLPLCFGCQPKTKEEEN